MVNSEIIQLKDQHIILLTCLAKTREYWKHQKFVAVGENLRTLRQLLIEHQNAEMQIIYDPMKTNPQLREGGPMCTFFFDARMSFNPLRITKTILADLSIPDGDRIPIELKSFFDENSPLSIPLEEHIAQMNLLDGLLEIPATQYLSFSKEIEKVFDLLQNLFDSNFEKEERCLFEFARRLLIGPTR